MYNSLKHYRIAFCYIFVWHYRINKISTKFCILSCGFTIVIISYRDVNIMIIDTVVKSLSHITKKLHCLIHSNLYLQVCNCWILPVAEAVARCHSTVALVLSEYDLTCLDKTSLP